MVSELASQLAKIATGNTVILDRKKQKAFHSKSLIFEASEAASQDYETIFSFASDGLSELELIDPRFAAFRANIFSETSITIDRNTQVRFHFHFHFHFW